MVTCGCYVTFLSIRAILTPIRVQKRINRILVEHTDWQLNQSSSEAFVRICAFVKYIYGL